MVEDDPGDVLLVREMLRTSSRRGAAGFSCETRVAGTLREAIEALEKEPCDLILVDLSLTDSAGLETVRALRRAAPETALVVLSGLEDEEVALSALQHGAQDYLVKGRIDPEQLARSIRYSLERAEAERLSTRRHAALRDAQKMDAIGRLAGGIAHDFNNVLTTVLGQAALLLGTVEDADARESLEEIRKAGERAAVLTRHLLTLSRRRAVETQLLNLNVVVVEGTDLLQEILGKHVSLEAALDGALGPWRGDRSQIEQTLVNLAMNARDAMPGGGTFLLRTSSEEMGPGDPQIPGSPAPGTYVRLEVSDTGTGMSAAALEHAFEPFFTTKARGQGTGLGLATVHGIVTQAGGSVRLASEPGKGTTVTILLPVAAPGSQPASGEEDWSESPGPLARPVILLVDDEPGIVKMVASQLDCRGYRVFSAPDAAAALSLAASNEEAIDLLVTDLTMPGIGGRELAERLKRERPGLRTLFMSGYADEAIDRSKLPAGEAFLAKPFLPRELAGAVERALGG